MNKITFVPPIPPTPVLSDETKEQLNSISPKERRKMKKDPRISAVLKKKRENRRKAQKKQRAEWWWTKGLIIINTILALIAAITGIIALFR